MSQHDLEDRLVRFTIDVINLTEEFPNTKIGLELKGQLIRSSTSASLNYGEAQGAESRKDFIHKLKVVLKELRESHVNLKIGQGIKIVKSVDQVKYLIKETNELISIIVVSIRTAAFNDELASSVKKRKS
jgi:four helix bundle protein